ncbi:hypothetical protein RUND412_004571 [Rhizina undulata]
MNEVEIPEDGLTENHGDFNVVELFGVGNEIESIISDDDYMDEDELDEMEEDEEEDQEEEDQEQEKLGDEGRRRRKRKPMTKKMTIHGQFHPPSMRMLRHSLPIFGHALPPENGRVTRHTLPKISGTTSS